MSNPPPKDPRPRFRESVHEVIFEAETPMGKLFDVALLWAIVISVGAVILESVEEVRLQWGSTLIALEWVLTGLFTVEYVLRLVSVRKPWLYVRSFFGIVDLLAILPAYLSLFVGGTQSLLVVRSLRLLRVFRVLKLARFVDEARLLGRALGATRHKITIFLGVILVLALIMGSLMYLVEGPEHGFTSIPQSIYWAIVTLTTVGYGDIHPQTGFGQGIAAIVMLMGYSIIAVPTGIVSVELAEATRQQIATRSCTACSLEGHALDAVHCKYCGEAL